MKIPEKYQIFDYRIVITEANREGLEPSLAGWPTLQRTILAREDVSQYALSSLIILELMGRRRPVIIDRLVMRLGKIHQHEIRKRIEKLALKK